MASWIVACLNIFFLKACRFLKKTYDEKLRSICNDGETLANNLDNLVEHVLNWKMQTIYSMMHAKWSIITSC